MAGKMKQLVVTIEARFDIPDHVEDLSCIGEAIEALQSRGEAKIIDMDVKEAK